MCLFDLWKVEREGERDTLIAVKKICAYGPCRCLDVKNAILSVGLHQSQTSQHESTKIPYNFYLPIRLGSCKQGHKKHKPNEQSLCLACAINYKNQAN